MNILQKFDPGLASQNPNARFSRKDFFSMIQTDPSKWAAIQRLAKDTRHTETEVMQGLSPNADAGSTNCGLDYLHSQGIYVKNSPENGIVSTPVADTENMDPITRRVYDSYMIDQQKVGIHSFSDKQREVKKYADAMHRLKIDDSLSEVERGTILRQWGRLR